jgi:anti-sigma regulatory factor (Ser/Thr protein kinase)
MPETLVVQADIAELARVSAWTDDIGERLALPASILFALHLCFEEAISNIVRHGFRDRETADGTDHDVCLELTREVHAVTVTIEDRGAAFDPREALVPPTPTTIEEAEIGGLGIHLMRQFTQQMDYQRLDGTNRLTLRFDLQMPSA